MQDWAIDLVRKRAGDRCEYCRLAQELSGLRFHIEHIIPRKHGGTDDVDNLALACPECNLRKGPNLSGIDPETGKVTRLFHPRRQNWDDHFRAASGRLNGKTAAGRATIKVLGINMAHRVGLRRL